MKTIKNKSLFEKLKKCNEYQEMIPILLEAASYIYSEREFEAFTQPNDRRPKTWLIYPKAKELAQ